MVPHYEPNRRQCDSSAARLARPPTQPPDPVPRAELTYRSIVPQLLRHTTMQPQSSAAAPTVVPAARRALLAARHRTEPAFHARASIPDRSPMLRASAAPLPPARLFAAADR